METKQNVDAKRWVYTESHGTDTHTYHSMRKERTRKRTYGKDEDVMADKKKKTDAFTCAVSWARNGKFLAVATDKGRLHSWYLQIRDDEDQPAVYILGYDREKANMRYGLGPALQSTLENILPSSLTEGEGVGSDGVLRGPRAKTVISAAATAAGTNVAALQLAVAHTDGKPGQKRRKGSHGGSNASFNNGAVRDVIEAVAASPVGAAVAVLAQAVNKATKAGRKAPYSELVEPGGGSSRKWKSLRMRLQ